MLPVEAPGELADALVEWLRGLSGGFGWFRAPGGSGSVGGEVDLVVVRFLPHRGARAGPRWGSGPRGVARPYRARSNYCRSFATIASMFRSASAVMVTNGFTPTLPGTRDPSTT